MKKYVTKSQDTWDLIAKRLFGAEIFMDQLIQANLLHRKTTIFSEGVVLNVPDVDTESVEYASKLPPWKRSRSN